MAAEKEQAAVADDKKSPGGAAEEQSGEKVQEGHAATEQGVGESPQDKNTVEDSSSSSSSSSSTEPADPLSNEHALQLARLTHELATRKSLSGKIGALELQKRKAIEKLEQVNATVRCGRTSKRECAFLCFLVA